MTRVGLRELKARLSDYVARAGRGEVVIVTNRNKPIAQLAPIEAGNSTLQELWRLAAAGTIQWSGGKPEGVDPHTATKISGTPTLSDLVVEERDER
jgi:prevent-host-death family protein